MTQQARDVLARIDGMVADNESALHAVAAQYRDRDLDAWPTIRQRLDKVMAGLQNLTGGTDGNGQIGQAADSIRRLADDLDKNTNDISAGLTQFSNSGLKEFEAFAVDGRRTLAELQQGDQEYRSASDPADFRALTERFPGAAQHHKPNHTNQLLELMRGRQIGHVLSDISGRAARSSCQAAVVSAMASSRRSVDLDAGTLNNLGPTGRDIFQLGCKLRRPTADRL